MRIEFDSERFDHGYRVITVDGVGISIDLLSVLAHPNPDRLYSMERVGDVIPQYSRQAKSFENRSEWVKWLRDPVRRVVTPLGSSPGR